MFAKLEACLADWLLSVTAEAADNARVFVDFVKSQHPELEHAASDAPPVEAAPL